MRAIFHDTRKHAAPTPRPFAQERTTACRRDYDDAKASLLGTVAEPRRLTGNATHDGQAWEARCREHGAAQRRFDAVFYDLRLEFPELIKDHAETTLVASRLLDATSPAPAVIERPFEDDIDRNIYVEGRNGISIGTIVPEGKRFRAFAADGTALGVFADQQSASAAIRADAAGR